ncbi:MAG: 3-dehydroquinate synthase [Clostridia bacterium]|nr:3-dehydroquinate synthase [Clostridia bacterium]
MGEMKVELGDRSYFIYIQKGLIRSVAQHIQTNFHPTSICIVTDSNVSALYLAPLQADFARLGLNVCSFVMEAGESSKNFSVLQQLCSFLIEQKFDRNSLLVAFGGGVVGDLTGFAASIYKRGIAFVQVPTTVVAQTDSAIGGKTGVDFGGAKNMLGAIHQPKAVYVDPDVLATLPDQFLSDGLGEVVKYAILAGGDLYDRVTALQSPTDFLHDDGFIIESCIGYKKYLVEKDERDTGDRMLLNLGHTIGHAVESYYGYGRYSHGEGVSIGLVEILRYAISYCSLRKDILHLITNLLQRLNLPIELPERNAAIFTSIIQDKKCAGQSIRIALPYAPGDVRIVSVQTEDFIQYLCSDHDTEGDL